MFIKHSKIGDVFTARREVLNEENESHVQHRYAVVVQDLHSYWFQSYPTKSKQNCASDNEMRAKVRAARSENQV